MLSANGVEKYALIANQPTIGAEDYTYKPIQKWIVGTTYYHYRRYNHVFGDYAGDAAHENHVGTLRDIQEKTMRS